MVISAKTWKRQEWAMGMFLRCFQIRIFLLISPGTCRADESSTTSNDSMAIENPQRTVLFLTNLKCTCCSTRLEVEMIHKAHKLGLLTTPYAFNPDEAVAMAKAGASIIVAHMGLTTSGSIGAKTAITLDDSVGRVQAIADAAIEINSEIIVLCHGGTSLL